MAKEYKTPLDTDAIVEIRRTVEGIIPTSRIRTRKRIELRKRIARELYELEQLDDEHELRLGHGGGRPAAGVARERKAFLAIGLPGSGKSTLAKRISEVTRSLVVNSDMAKAKLPEFARANGATAVHEESAALILPLVLRRAVINGDNLALHVVGRSLPQLRARIRLLRMAGYEAHLLLSDMDPMEAAKRVIERWRQTGRFVDPDYIFNVVANAPRRNYDALKRSGELTSYARYVADPPKGDPPRPAERSEGSPGVWD